MALEQYRSIPNGFLWVLPNIDHDVVFPLGGSPHMMRDEFTRVALDFLTDGKPFR